MFGRPGSPSRVGAAVADYRPNRAAEKQHGPVLPRSPGADAGHPRRAWKAGHPGGFAAENDDLVTNAREKLQRKNLDLVVANDVGQAGAGFDVDTNVVTILDAMGGVEELPLLSKREVADRILDRVKGLLQPSM
jgi:phosphopantothenoylcysteine decarboxylase/phosphopantothenate--cysteine ligase